MNLPERLQRVLVGAADGPRRADPGPRHPGVAAHSARWRGGPARRPCRWPRVARRSSTRRGLPRGTQPIRAVRDLPVAGRPGRLYTPAEPGPAAPRVYFHGGGWMYGDLDSHDAACRFLAERSGVRVLAVDYRLGPEHPFPAAYDDALAAYEWVVANAESLGADPARLAVGGDSAGGNLAAVTAIEAARRGWPLAFQLLRLPRVRLHPRHSEPRRCSGKGLCGSPRATSIWEPRATCHLTSTGAIPGSHPCTLPCRKAWRRRTSSRRASTRCATRARPTRASWSRRG